METKLEHNSELDNIIEDRIYYSTFFGKSVEYYQDRYERFSEGTKATFNPYAFVFGAFWIAYRKMYVELIIFMLAIIALQTILIVTVNLEIGWSGKLLFAGIVGGCANYFYFKKATRTVTKAKEMYANITDQLDYIKKEGGVSYVSVIVLGIIIILFFIGLLFSEDYLNTLYFENN